MFASQVHTPLVKLNQKQAKSKHLMFDLAQLIYIHSLSNEDLVMIFKSTVNLKVLMELLL